MCGGSKAWPAALRLLWPQMCNVIFVVAYVVVCGSCCCCCVITLLLWDYCGCDGGGGYFVINGGLPIFVWIVRVMCGG